jgi:hypothetical protein
VSSASFSRRRFLSASLRGTCAVSFLASCGAKGAPSAGPTTPTAPSGAAPRTLFAQDFNSATLGPYGADALAAGWMGVSPYNGVREGRTAIVDGADAREGRSLRVLYPRGGVSSEPSGAQWKMPVGRYDELYCAYSVRFAPGFDFVKGGKLPGFAGGAANTGGNKPSGRDGWSARMMWREGGHVVQYVYHVDQPTMYGEDFDWNVGGQRVFRPGTWHRVEHRVVINTPGQRDGIVQGWFDGAMALDRRGIRFRDVDAFAIDAFYFSTFFGGSDPTWAAAKDEYVYFDQFVIATGRG